MPSQRLRRGVYSKAPEPTPLDHFRKMLTAGGGQYWCSRDGTKSRVYFNHVETSPGISLYYDLETLRWSDEALGAETLANIYKQLPVEQHVPSPLPVSSEEVSAQRDAERATIDAKNAEAAQTMAFVGGPKLSGSAKQVAWAESLRLRMINFMSASGFSDEKIADVLNDKEAKKAKFWIDNRRWVEEEEDQEGGIESMLRYLDRPSLDDIKARVAESKAKVEAAMKAKR